MDASAAWTDGMSLADAWFQFGDPELKEHYRDSGRNPQRTAWLCDMMRRQLVDEIARGTLSCFGLRTAPDFSPGPEQVPSFLFSVFGSVNWDESSVVGFQRRYEGVRIPQRFDSKPGDEKADQTPSQTDQASQSWELVKVIDHAQRQLKKEGKGRPSTQPQLREIVTELQEQGRLSGLMRKEQERLVREIARERHPSDFPKPQQPSRPSILKALSEMVTATTTFDQRNKESQ